MPGHEVESVTPAAPRISVVTVAYNSGASLERLLRSLEPEADGALEVVVVNNGSRGSETDAAERLPFARVLEPGGNVGFGAGANLGAREASGDVLVFLNPDTVAVPGALRALAQTLDDPSIAIAMPRLRLLERPDLLNSGGNVVHVTGLAWAGGYGEPADSVAELREIPYASGAALAIRADRFRELGGFTEELFMYQEDLELAWRARLRGLRVVVTPRADIQHEYEFARNERKQYLLERNRLVFVASAYSWRLLGLLAPVLVSTEVAIAGLALKQGWFRQKAAGWGWVFTHARWLARHRRETQALRRVPDRELAGYLTPVVDPQMIDMPAAARYANYLVIAYWRGVRKVL